MKLSSSRCVLYFFSAGVTGLLPTELFNQTARPAAYMIAGSMMWLNLFITGMLFPFLVVSLSLHPSGCQHLSPYKHAYIHTEWFVNHVNNMTE